MAEKDEISFLNPKDGPVCPGLEQYEKVYAKAQPQYNPLRTLVSNRGERSVLSRWGLTEEQRAKVAAGADIYLELLTFGDPLQPIRMGVGGDLEPDTVAAALDIQREQAG